MAYAAAQSYEVAVDYPESDGQPMAETEAHFDCLTTLVQTLKRHFAARNDVYVIGNLFLYYQQGDRNARVAPDVFVVVGVPNHRRRVYKLWEEGLPPCLVFELTSRSTRKEDLHFKRDLYAQLGVEEYVLFDPLAEYLKPPLQGFRLRLGRYQPIPVAADGSVECRSLGLRVYREDTGLRLVDATSGERLLSAEEDAQRSSAALRQTEETNRELAAEVARLRAELAAQKAG